MTSRRTYYVIQMQPPRGDWRDATGARYDDELDAKRQLTKIRERFLGELGVRLVERTDIILTDLDD